MPLAMAGNSFYYTYPNGWDRRAMWLGRIVQSLEGTLGMSPRYRHSSAAAVINQAEGAASPFASQARRGFTLPAPWRHSPTNKLAITHLGLAYRAVITLLCNVGFKSRNGSLV